MYHCVNDRLDASPHGFLGFSPAEFRAHLRWFRRAGYTFMSVSQLWDWLRADTDHAVRPVVLTFDDGFRDNLEVVAPAIVTALDEIGVSLGGEFPKPLTDEAVRAADVVVTMGCGDACPVYPGRRYLDWDLDDPVDQPLATVRRIRDDIDNRVRHLLVELFTQPSPI